MVRTQTQIKHFPGVGCYVEGANVDVWRKLRNSEQPVHAVVSNSVM